MILGNIATIDDFVHEETEGILEGARRIDDVSVLFRVDGLAIAPYLIHIDHEDFKLEIIGLHDDAQAPDLTIVSVSLGEGTPRVDQRATMELRKHHSRPIYWSRYTPFSRIPRQAVNALAHGSSLRVEVLLSSRSSRLRTMVFAMARRVRRYRI